MSTPNRMIWLLLVVWAVVLATGTSTDATSSSGDRALDLVQHNPRTMMDDDIFRGRQGSYKMPLGIRPTFLAGLTRKGVSPGTAEVVAYALGEDEIDNLPPAMVSHMVATLLHVESVFKKCQMALATADSSASFLVSTLLPAEQMKMTAAVNTLLSPIGLLYGNDAIVKRIAQSLNAYFQRQLADPYPWTYELHRPQLHHEYRQVPLITRARGGGKSAFRHQLTLRDLDEESVRRINTDIDASVLL